MATTKLQYKGGRLKQVVSSHSSNTAMIVVAPPNPNYK